MSQQPMVSVIVPVYKVEKYLSECVDSILNQTYEDFELILVDDGSPDRCGEICDEYARMDKRVKVIHQANGGVSHARNMGISAARGKYLMFVDSDDTIDREFFQNAVHEAERYSADLYLSGLVMETWDQNTIVRRIEYRIQENTVYSIKELFENLEVTYPLICICGPWCKLYVREKIEKANLRFDESMSLGEDTYFNLHYHMLCNMVVFSSEIFYHYRRGNSDSLFSKVHKDTFEIHSKVYDKMQSVMISAGCNEASMQRFQAIYVNLLIGCIHSCFRVKGQFSRKEKLNMIQKVSNYPLIQNTSFLGLDRKMSIIVYLLKKHKENLVLAIFQVWYGLRFLRFNSV